MWIVLFAECLVLGLLYITAWRGYGAYVRQHKTFLKLPALAPVSLYIIDRFGLINRLNEAVVKIQLTMSGLYGRKYAPTRTKLFLADTVSLIIAALLGMTLLGGAAGGDPSFLGYGAVIAGFLPFLLYKQLAGQLEQKKRSMLIELPEMLNQLTLLINAGETVHRALLRCVETGKDAESSPLMKELAQSVHELNVNAPFAKTMEDFSKRCALQEVSMFTTTLLLNYKRGGDDLVLALKELSTALWEKRKAVARTMGEEASSKMVFPMVIIFVVVMVITAAPALFMMNN
ncbi:type II secretion system F family protein [Paenibacillus hamazuiensis]|uniref:type II secretion system F family protein n=1 Tax=Paenibacillus hamazuiensis TaxID=2936508 RepID=UPI00200C490E|nr:type II secretion system F family protein [Paenibacillus hamazuiensis]